MPTTDQLDKIKLYAIFPAEIWIKILGMLSCFTDYRNISAAAKPFQQTLHSLRVTVLFSDVLKILRNGQRKSKAICFSDNNYYYTLRQVRSSWRRGVNGELHNTDSTFDFYHYPQFMQDEDFTIFWEYFGDASSNVNPFPFRSVRLCVFYCLFEGSHLQFVGEMLKMLHKFGHHIWYCDFYVDANPETLKEFYDVFLEFVKAMPNLRWLNFEKYKPLEQEERHILVEKTLPIYRFPKSEHLWWLQIKDMAPIVTEQLLESNPQIRVVDGSPHQLYLERLPNLEQLTMHLDNLTEFETFRNYKVVGPLRKLDLQMRFSNLPWNSVLPTLAYHFGKTLVELKLDFCNTNLQKTVANGEDLLPSPALKTVLVSMNHAVGLDFLLPLRENVENLSVMVHQNDIAGVVQQTENTIRLYQFKDHLEHSNIWELFAKLRLVSFLFWGGEKVVCSKKLVGNQTAFKQYVDANNVLRF